MSLRVVATLTVGAGLLFFTASAYADSYRIGPLSQQLGPGAASIGASISVSSTTPGSSGGSPSSPPPSRGQSGPPPVVPTMPSNWPLFQNPHPAGPNSLWTQGINGQQCIYVPNGVAPCFNVAPPAGAPAAPTAPPVNPAALAASAANQLDLGPGRIEASPSAQVNGLTGAASWFWLSPAPSSRSVSVGLRGEHVTVTARPDRVTWSFGDGSGVDAGPGVPYTPGPPPAGAIRHVYQTRCLPGDQGRDPYVLSSCGADGYTVTVTLGWSVSYTATGPVSASGGLPARTTSTTLAYPVSEARGFLTAGGGA
jgi:hypothetical protein